MKKYICPACGSEDITNKIEEIVYEESYSDIISTKGHIVWTCKTCGSEGDFRLDNQNDNIIDIALNEVYYTVVRNIMKHFNEKELRTVNIEHMLGLKFGYIDKQLKRYEKKKTPVEQSLVTLLQLVRTYPWLLNDWFVRKDLRVGYSDSCDFIKNIYNTK
jgi:predicted nucleic-acid-binding Zn-ribbon protein